MSPSMTSCAATAVYGPWPSPAWRQGAVQASTGLRWPRFLPAGLGLRLCGPGMMRRPFDLSKWSDADLVAACRNGDPRAWRAFVDRYRRLVYGIPRALGLQAADAEDVFQQTFAGFCRSLPNLRDATRVGAWLATTARRHTIRLRRDERRRARVSSDPAADAHAASPDPTAATILERLQEVERVRKAVDALGEPCRSLLLGLFADPPKSYRVLAEETGFAIGSLGSARVRCLERLRLRLRRGREAAEDHLPRRSGERNH